MKYMAITSAGLAELEAKNAAFDALTDEQRKQIIRARASRPQPPVKPAAPKANRPMTNPKAQTQVTRAAWPAPAPITKPRASTAQISQATAREVLQAAPELRPIIDRLSSTPGLSAEQARGIDRLSFGEKPHSKVHMQGTRQVLGGFRPASGAK